jgi:hypothetical protein
MVQEMSVETAVSYVYFQIETLKNNYFVCVAQDILI